MEQIKGCRLVLIPLPLQGHINPMLQLAQILHSKGFSITMIHTSFNSPNPSNYPHFTFHFIPYDYNQSHSSAPDILDFLTAINVHCVEPFRECLRKLMISDASEEPVACLISDAMCFFTQAVADSLRLPRIVLRTSGISSFVAFAAFPILREKGYIPVKGQFLSLSFMIGFGLVSAKLGFNTNLFNKGCYN